VGDEERPASPLAIALFGAFDVRLHGCPLPRLHSQKTQWLLVLLTLQAGRPVERAWLARTLWPESAEPQAAFNLRRNLWYLRQSLGHEARRLEAPTTGTLRLNLVGAEADLLLFDEAIRRGDARSLERAVALRRGPLLQGCEEEWIFPERAAREEAYLQALETLAAHASARGEPGAALRYLRRAAAADPLRDSAQRALMQALAATGDLAAATQVYRDFRLLLHRELNAAPDPETLDTYRQIQAEVRERAALGARRSARQPQVPFRPAKHRAPGTQHRRPPSTEHQAPSTGAQRPTCRGR
jgi:DNA-binding SARP family transcriptional activator